MGKRMLSMAMVFFSEVQNRTYIVQGLLADF
jgi:hypothetical protein